MWLLSHLIVCSPSRDRGQTNRFFIILQKVSEALHTMEWFVTPSSVESRKLSECLILFYSYQKGIQLPKAAFQKRRCLEYLLCIPSLSNVTSRRSWRFPLYSHPFLSEAGSSRLQTWWFRFALQQSLILILFWSVILYFPELMILQASLFFMWTFATVGRVARLCQL